MKYAAVRLFPLIFCLVTGSQVHAWQGSFTVAQVMSAPFASEMIAAPAGARVAWLLNQQGKRNVWVASAPDWKGRKVTVFDEDDGQDIAELAWAPDGSYLLFAHGGDFETGGDNPNPNRSPQKPEQTIWHVAMDGAPAKKFAAGHAPVISPKAIASHFSAMAKYG